MGLFNRDKKSNKSRKTGKTKTSTKSTGNKIKPVKIKTHNDRKGGHPHLIMDNIDNNHVSIGLTTKHKKGKNSTNYKCDVNPLGGEGKSYMRRQGTVAPKNEYSGERTGKLSQKDFAQAKQYSDKAKQKYLDKKKK